MTDLTKPKFCNQAQHNEPIQVLAVTVRSCSGTRTVPFGSVAEVGSGKKLTGRVRHGLQVVAWHAWCIECWDEYQETKQLKNLQSEMVV